MPSPSPLLFERLGPTAALTALMLVAGACDSTPITEPEVQGDLETRALTAALAVDAPVIDPVVGHFRLTAGDLGEPTESNSLSVSPLVSLTDEARSDFAESALTVTVSPDGATQVISIQDQMNTLAGATEAGASFAVQFDVLEEVTYEIFGTTAVDFLVGPTRAVQVATSIQFNKLSDGFEVLYFEGDNNFGTSSLLEFSLNGINEGNVGGGTTAQGTRTGVLQPGRYGFDGLTFTFGRDGGFASQGIGELAIRLTATAPRDPSTIQDCFQGGWEAFGFKNQGQCVRFVKTGEDSR